MTKRLSDMVIDSFERLSLRADVVHVYSDDLRSMLEEIRASRKAASVVRDALMKCGHSPLKYEGAWPTSEEVCNDRAKRITVAQDTLANPDVISWMGGEV